MDIGFIAPVNKTSGTSFSPSGATDASSPGFRDQINHAIRNYDDPERDRAVEKKPVGQKKTSETETSRNSAKAEGKADAAKRDDRSTGKYANNEEAAAARMSGKEETSETSDSELVSAGDDSGFYGELKDAENSENSDTENAFMMGIAVEETSETENAYTLSPEVEGTPVPDDLADASVSSSSSSSSSIDALIFQSLPDGNDSGFAALMNMEAVVENAASDAGSNAAQNAGANSAPVAASEVISQMILDQAAAALPREEADVNVRQNVSSSGSETADSMKELLAAMADDAESAEAESARPELNEILDKELLSKSQAAAQNAGRNDSVSLRGEKTRQEIQPEAKATVNAEPEVSKQTSARASSENEALIMERMAAQTARTKNVAALANASENAGKTVQVAETSFQMTSGTAKAEVSVPTRNVPLSDQEFVIELAGRIQAQIRGGREMIRIQLHPEELGRLEIRAESGRNGIVARIAAESHEIKKLLESNLQGLQQSLEARGLKVDRLHIVVEDSAEAALFADGGRYGHAGTGPRNSEVTDDYSRSVSARSDASSSREDELYDLSVEAAQRGVAFYTVG